MTESFKMSRFYPNLENSSPLHKYLPYRIRTRPTAHSSHTDLIKADLNGQESGQQADKFPEILHHNKKGIHDK